MSEMETTSTPVDDIQSLLEATKAPLAEAKTRIEQEIKEHDDAFEKVREEWQEKRGELRSRLARIDRTLSTLDPEPRKKRAKQQRRSMKYGQNVGSTVGVSEATIDRFYDAIVAAGHPVTIREMAEKLGVSGPTASEAMRVLRFGRETIRLVGKEGSALTFMPMTPLAQAKPEEEQASQEGVVADTSAAA